MKKFLSIAAIAILAATASAFPASADDSETLVLQFLGTATGVSWDGLSDDVVTEIMDLDDSGKMDVEDLEGFACFELDLVDPSSGVSVGTAVDCLAPSPQTNGVIVEAFSFFMLPGGSFVSNGMTSVSPFFPGIGDAGGAFTHMTGSLPTKNNIIGATGQFKDKGTTRVSGAVDLSRFGEGIVAFNCLWVVVVELDDDDD